MKLTDPEKFSKLASGVQSWITSVAIVVGGVWILFTFWALGSTNKSRAEVAELEQRAVEQPVLTTQMKSTVFGDASDGKRFISLEVLLRNDGKRALEFQDPVVQVSRLATEGVGMATEGEGQRVPAVLLSDQGLATPMPERILRSGQGRTIAFLIPAAAAGSYLVQFRSTYTGKKLVDGRFEPSSDEVIEAIEQSIVNVPQRHSEKSVAPNPALQRAPQERRR